MTKKSLIALIIVIVLIVLAGVAGSIVYFFTKGPDLAQFEHLKAPQITNRPDEQVIAVKLEGVPGDVAGQAISDLYKIYYQLDVDKNTPVAPKARWKNFKEGEETLAGEFALTVPTSVSSIPENANGELVMWDYGDTAEILHVGSYDAEDETIEKLKQYINNEGYEIVGDHEEEYIKGPGMFFEGNPDKYYTIIRYQVKKK
ncbi:GyrI-like domain-containing protein [Patescibacteria group bacterium]|nr:GyrI-like domain-containing protein [Patescibacteria group bacterium]